MMKKTLQPLDFKFLDFIPAISGLIGKIALVSSFAFVWAQELMITTPNFVFDNVRIEIIIGSIITLLIALVLPNIAPAGTLAPLVVMIPAMVSFGVHPLILSVMIGIIGILSVKTKIIEKLILTSGNISKISLILVFGVSGVILSTQKLLSFFDDNYFPLVILICILLLANILLLRHKKNWLIIPFAAIISILIPFLFGIKIDTSLSATHLSFSPAYWWNDMWGIGFGLNVITILKTLPFALFAILLWAIDTISINALIDANYNNDEKREHINFNKTFVIISIRNIIGGLCGGAQTSAIWRSYLIPLFLVKRPVRSSSILLGVLGIIAGITVVPIKILSFPPLIWSVLLFGIFIPFVISGVKSIRSEHTHKKPLIFLLILIGVLFSPVLTWIGSFCYEKFAPKLFKN